MVSELDEIEMNFKGLDSYRAILLGRKARLDILADVCKQLGIIEAVTYAN